MPHMEADQTDFRRDLFAKRGDVLAHHWVALLGHVVLQEDEMQGVNCRLWEMVSSGNLFAYLIHQADLG